MIVFLGSPPGGRGGPSCGCTHHTATAERGARRATRHLNLHHGRCRGRCRALVIVPPPAPASSSPQYLLGGCTSSAQCGRLGDRAASSHAAAVSVRTRRTRRSISAPLPLRSSARDERDDLGVAIFAGRRVGSAFSAARRPSSRAISRGRPERPSARRGRAPPKPRGATPRRARARRAHRRRPTARRHSRCRRRCVRLRACCAQLTARRAPPQCTRRGGARYAC